MILPIVLALQLSLHREVTDQWVAETIEKARPIATCREGPDCAAKWARARRWVRENSRFALARETDSLLITYGAIYANLDASFAVVLSPERNGQRIIRFRAWCGNWIACRPTARTWRRLFQQAMEDADAR